MSDETSNPQGQTPEQPSPEQPPAETTVPIPPAPPEPPALEPAAVTPFGQSAEVPASPGAQVEPPKVRKKRVGLLAVVLIGLLLIGAGAAAAVMLALRGTGDVLLKKAPENSLIYVTAYLDPAAAQKINIEGLLRKFPKVGQADLGKQFDDFMNGALEGTGLDYQKDVKSWLGTQIGFVVIPDGSQPQVAALLASKDDGAAATSLAKMKSGDQYSGVKWKDQDYKGVTITTGSYDMSGMGIDMGAMSPAMVYAIVDGAAVLSNNENAVKAIVDTSKGDTKSLADNATYADTMAQLPKERVADMFLNGGELVDLVKRSADLSSLSSMSGAGTDPLGSLEAIRGAGVSLSVESDGVLMSMASLMDTSKMPKGSAGAPPHENAVITWTPADAYGFFAGGNLQQSIKAFVDQMEQASPGSSDAVDQMGLGKAMDALSGDFGVAVTPGAGQIPAGAALMATNDEAAMQDALDGIAAIITSSMASDFGGMDPAAPSMDNALPLKFETPAPTWQTEEYKGVNISYLPLPDMAAEGVVPAYAVTDGMAIIATTPVEVKKLIDAHGGQQITSSPNYKAAMAHADAANGGMFYMDMEAIIRDAASGDPEVANDMKPLKAIVMTSGGTSEKPTATLFILIK